MREIAKLFPGIIGMTATVGLVVIGITVPASRTEVITALAGTGGGFWGYLQRDRDGDGYVARQESGTIVVAGEGAPRNVTSDTTNT